MHRAGVGDPQLRLPGVSQFVVDPDFKPNNATNNATHLAFCQGGASFASFPACSTLTTTVARPQPAGALPSGVLCW